MEIINVYCQKERPPNKKHAIIIIKPCFHIVNKCTQVILTANRKDKDHS